MKFKVLLYIALSSVSGWSRSQDLNFYLGRDPQFAAAVPIPEEVLGYQVGQWHVRHDQVVAYIQALA